MKPRISFLVTILVLALVGAILAGCESTDLTAEESWLLSVIAVPPQPVVNEETGRARTVIVAKIVDGDDVPVESVAVTFNATAGSFVDNVCGPAGCSVGGGACTTDADCPLPPTVPVSGKTDVKGLTQTGFFMDANSGPSVTVTATSGALSNVVTVTNQLGEVNQKPLASWVAAPSSPAFNGLPVTLDGRGSTDPDGDELTCFKWKITSSEPIVGPEIECDPPDVKCEYIQGANFVDLSSPKYTKEQELHVKLWVSDDPDAAACPRGGPILPDSLFGDFDDNDNAAYVICNNTDPVADAGPSGPASDYGQITLEPVDPTDPFTSYRVTQILDGTDSHDAESTNEQLTFEWSCGNGQSGTGVGLQEPTCVYTSAANYVIRLRVSDPGGSPSPQSGCERQSGFSESTIQVLDP